MITTTKTGFKVLLTPVDDIKEAGNFFRDLHSEGLWYALFGQHFTESLHDAFNLLLDFSDGAVIVALVFCILAMFGSQRARKALYWTFAIYLVLRILGLMI